MAVNSTKFPANAAHTRSTTSRRAARAKHPSDDEILGLVTSVERPAPTIGFDSNASDRSSGAGATVGAPAVAAGQDSAGAAASKDSHAASAAGPALSPELAQILDANPQVRDAVATAQQFRAIFPTPAAAQDAKTQLDELDAMFFSGAPADHAALAARIHELSPEAFQGLTQAMQAHAGTVASSNKRATRPSAVGNSTDENAGGINPPLQTSTNVFERGADSGASDAGSPADAAAALAAEKPASVPQTAPSRVAQPASETGSPTSETLTTSAPRDNSSAVGRDPRRAAKVAFFHSTNAAVVQKIVAAIESQVNHLLPESISAGAKTRIVGEIYRDLDATLRGNQQLGKQLRDAFASAATDGANPGGDTRAHQQAIVTLMAGRARQALPSIAKRVINEWTHGVMAANRERLARHESAAKRVDIAGGGASDGVNRKPMSPRDMDYKRLSDSDILNL